jgi:hypothetical protein
MKNLLKLFSNDYFWYILLSIVIIFYNGNVMRGRVIPHNPNSDAQALAKNYLSGAASAWGQLSAAQIIVKILDFCILICLPLSCKS